MDEIYEYLNRAENAELSRSRLKSFLQSQLARKMMRGAEEEQIAYEIAGLLSTTFARSLELSDPYMRLLLLAAQLELPQKHREPSATWAEFERLLFNV